MDSSRERHSSARPGWAKRASATMDRDRAASRETPALTLHRAQFADPSDWVEREADREVAFGRYRRVVGDLVSSSSR